MSFATLLTVDNYDDIYDNWVVKSLVKLLFTQGVHSFGKPKEAFKVFTFDVKDCDMLNCQGFDDLTSMTIQHIKILCLCNIFAIQNLVLTNVDTIWRKAIFSGNCDTAWTSAITSSHSGHHSCNLDRWQLSQTISNSLKLLSHSKTPTLRLLILAF